MSSIDTCEKCGEDYNIKTVHQCSGKMSKSEKFNPTFELTLKDIKYIFRENIPLSYGTVWQRMIPFIIKKVPLRKRTIKAKGKIK